MNAFCKRFLIILFFISFTGCGFHLRGQLPLAPPLYRLYLQTPDPYGQLSHFLEDSLRCSGVCLVGNPSQAAVILVILSEVTGQQLLSVSGSQQTRQYNLILTVTFQLVDTANQIIVPPITLAESRTMPVSSNQILGGSNEANNLYNQMRQAIVFDILNRLASQQVTCLLQKRPPR